jgi:predicted Zn-dependent protease with MMP-like domain
VSSVRSESAPETTPTPSAGGSPLPRGLALTYASGRRTGAGDDRPMDGQANYCIARAGTGCGLSRSLPVVGTKIIGRTRRSRLCPSTDSGIVAEMDARSEPGLNDPYEEALDDALSSLPADLRAAMSNVEIVVEDEPPDGQPLLGLYRGVPLPRRSSTYSGVLPDKISIFRGPITRLAAGDADRVRREVRHVALHEIAHHFGISDARLIELDRY